MDMITPTVKRLHEVGEYLPHLGSEKIIKQNLKYWLHDNKWNGITNGAVVQNVFTERLWNNYKKSPSLSYKFIMILENGSLYTNNVIDSYLRFISEENSGEIPVEFNPRSLREFIVKMNYGRVQHTVKSNKPGIYEVIETDKQSYTGLLGKVGNLKGYVFHDDENLTILKHFYKNNLHHNIFYLEYSGLADGSGKPKKQVLKSCNLPDVVKFETTDPAGAKLTKVMNAFMLDNDFDESIWHSTKNKVTNDAYLRINFKLSKSSNDVSNFLIREFKNNSVVPLRFNWSGYYTNRHIIGGSVLCPLDYYVKFTNRLKLYNADSINYSISFDGISNIILEDNYASIT